MADEPTLRSLVKPRFRGTFIGGAIGDALGFPFEGSSRAFMKALGSDVLERFEKHRNGYYPAGQFSDDTQMTLATVESILDSGGVSGESLVSHFSSLWRDNTIIGRDPECSQVMAQLMDPAADLESCGLEDGTGSGAVMRAAPIGLWNYDQPRRLLEDVRTACQVTHRDALSLAATAAIASAVAYNITHREVILGEFLDIVTEATGSFSDEVATRIGDLPRFLSQQEAPTLESFSDLGSSGAMFTAVVALYYFLRSPNDFARTVQGCLLVGGNADTLASVAGSLSGSLNGVEMLPAHLTGSLVQRQQIQELADRLHTRKEDERRRAR